MDGVARVMAGYLLDTNVVSASMVAHHAFHALVENRLQSLQGPIFVSVVVLEIKDGERGS